MSGNSLFPHNATHYKMQEAWRTYFRWRLTLRTENLIPQHNNIEKKKNPQIESSVKRGRETSRGVASLLSKMCEVEWLGQLFIGRGVSSTVYILVHLLGHLLHVAKVGCSHSNSEEGMTSVTQGSNKNINKIDSKNGFKWRGLNLLHHNYNVVNLNGL